MDRERKTKRKSSQNDRLLALDVRETQELERLRPLIGPAEKSVRVCLLLALVASGEDGDICLLLALLSIRRLSVLKARLRTLTVTNVPSIHRECGDYVHGPNPVGLQLLALDIHVRW